MSSPITDVRLALQGLLKGTPGINTALAYPPDEVSTPRTAWLGMATEQVTGGQRELGLHRLQCFFVVARHTDLAAEIAATEPVIDAIKAVLRVNQSLGHAGLVDRVAVTQVEQSIIRVGDVEHTGFVMELEIKVHQNVTLAG